MNKDKIEPTEYAKALRIVTDTLSKDKDLYYAFQSNIAVQFQDSCHFSGIKHPDLHKVSNDAAINFLNLLLK